MDPARVVEEQLLALQKPMHAVIDRGDSNVQQFYKDTTLFVTGGSGFLGKQLIQKIFRSCEIKKMYVLLRSKRGKNIQERLNSILKDAVFDDLREVKPTFADRIVPVEGDVADIRLGLRDEDWNQLAEEVNIIFHGAATVRFDEPIKKATIINIRGTRETLSLARDCKKFKCFIHTSTAFCHATKSRINTDVEEKFYPAPVPSEVMIELVQTLDDQKLNNITPNLIEGWPNTYTFTKAITEDMISRAEDIPVCIVRPPVVTSSYTEPRPGWIDIPTTLSSPLGALLGVGLGVLHVLYLYFDNISCYAPVDYVNNAIIAAGWDSTERRKKGDRKDPVYTISTSSSKITWRYFDKIFRSEEVRGLVSPKAIWYIECMVAHNRFTFWVLMWVFHLIPAYFIDALLDLFRARPKGIPRLVSVYSRAYKISLIYEYFTFNSWNFKDDNCQAMIKRMSPADKAIYSFDTRSIDFKLLVKAWCIGMRRYVVKDNLQGTVNADRRQKVLKYVRYIFLGLYLYFLYRVAYFVFNGLFSIVMSVF